MEISTSDIYGITLLSKEEAENFPKEIRAYNDWWWLRSPGVYQSYAARVYTDGSVNSSGSIVDFDDVCVRPALFLSHNNSDLKSGEIVEVFGRKWYYQGWETFPPRMSDSYVGLALLMDKPLTRMAFNKDPDKGNDYDNSDVKKWLNDWLNKKRNKAYLKEREEIEKGADAERIWWDEAEEILGKIGLTLDEAINIFIHQVVLRSGIPFEIKK